MDAILPRSPLVRHNVVGNGTNRGTEIGRHLALVVPNGGDTERFCDPCYVRFEKCARVFCEHV